MFKVSPRLSSMPPRGRPFNQCKAFTSIFSYRRKDTWHGRSSPYWTLHWQKYFEWIIIISGTHSIVGSPLRIYNWHKKKGREIAVFVENIKLHSTRAILSKSLLLLYSRRSHKWRTQDIECTQAFLSKPTLVLLQMRFNHIKMLQVISHAVSYLQSRQPYIQGASFAFNWISNKFKWQRKLWNKKGALPPKYSKHGELQSRMASRLFDLSLFFLWSPEAYPQGMLARGRIPCVRKIAFRRSFQLLIFLPTGKLVSFVDAAPEEFLKYQPQSPFPLSILKKASLGEIKPSNHCLASQSINTSWMNHINSLK